MVCFLEIKVKLDNPPSDAAIKTGITVPKSALIERGQLTGIFVPSDQNTALLRWVVPGRDLGDRIEILSGLSKQEQYILKAEARLMNGMPIIEEKLP